MRHSALICTIATLLWVRVAAGQLAPPEITVTPLPVGSGARALGRGGAFVAVADDATAASWNPAGLVQLEKPECSIVGSFLSATSDFSTDAYLTHIDRESTDRFDLNYFSVAYPFRAFGANMVAALNYQQKLDFHQDVTLDRAHDRPGRRTWWEEHIVTEAKGGVGALSPALGVQVTLTFSLGLAVNMFSDEFLGPRAWQIYSRGSASGRYRGVDFTASFLKKEIFEDFEAWSFTLGGLWDVWESEGRCVTLGLVFDSPYSADVDRRQTFRSASNGATIGPDKDREDLEIDFPMSVAAGVSVRESDAFSWAGDVTWTKWSSYEQKGDAGRSLPIGGNAGEGTRVKDAFDVRLGAEYLVFGEQAIYPWRAGLFYEQRPSLGAPTDVVGFSLGGGVTTKRFSIDWAYQLRYANNVDGRDIGVRGTEYDLTEHLFLTSVIVYF